MAGRRQSRVKYRPYDLDHAGDGLPPQLWRLLHRPLHLQSDTDMPKGKPLVN